MGKSADTGAAKGEGKSSKGKDKKTKLATLSPMLMATKTKTVRDSYQTVNPSHVSSTSMRYTIKMPNFRIII